MKRFFAVFFFLTNAACASEEIFPALGDELANPESMVVDSVARRLYVVNSNSLIGFEPNQGSFQVYDITDVQNPVLLGTAATESLSGELVLDSANQRAIVANRYSVDGTVTNDHLLSINVDEASADFLHVTEIETALDPYAVACCTAANQMLFTAKNGVLQYTDLDDATLSVESLDLLQDLSNGGSISQATLRDVVVSGSQAFVVRNEGGIYVINLDELGVSGKNPVDYFIADVRAPRSMAVDGNNLYITDYDSISGHHQFRVLILDVSSLVALPDNDDVEYLDKDDAGLVAGSVEVGDNPQNIIISGTQAFVGNYDDDTVSVIDLNSNTVTATIAVGDRPFSFAIDAPAAVDTTLFVGNLEDNSLTMIDLDSLNVLSTFTGP